MEVERVLHMNGGTGDTSYATCSYIQKLVLSMTQPIKEEAIRELYLSMSPATMYIADLGCSCGPNTFLAVSQLMATVEMTRLKLGLEPPEYQVYLNDLPGNDFNTVFKSWTRVKREFEYRLGVNLERCYVNGVPGSFYCRLFPARSLHFVHSSYSLMWLSQVPEGIEGNKGNIFMAKTSPPGVIKAYYEQYRNDFLVFLECRSEEVVAGGRMVLTILGRKSEDPTSDECCYIWEILARVLRDMVYEGLIQEEKLNTFNIPQYTPSPTELKNLVQAEGSFTVSDIQVSKLSWGAGVNKNGAGAGVGVPHYNFARCMRSVVEPLLVNHFGEEMVEEVFGRYEKRLSECITNEDPAFINVTISMTRK